jgi:predicted pyridoxine 5'-phosphate oxidase superfamily flavin-nucleotide-binding protein
MRILLNRIGDDTLAKLEAAARRRQAEARRLRQLEPLGSLYLYGYTIEMRLKTAYYRLTNVPENWNLDAPLAAATQSPRWAAQIQIKNLVGLAKPAEAGHHLFGWATLLISTRAGHVALGPFLPSFERRLSNHAQAAGQQWREILRYRASRPYDEEIGPVIDAANWFQRNYRRLWS